MKKYKIKSVLGRFSAVALSIALLSSFSSCQNKNQQQQKPPSQGGPTRTGKVMVIGKANPSDEAFWEYVGKGASDAAKELDIKVNYKCAEDDSDIETQKKYISEAIEKEYDVIVIAPNDRDGLTDVLGEASDAGIKIISIDSFTSFQGISCSIASSDNNAGQLAGSEAAKQLKNMVGKVAGVGKVGIIAGTSSTAEVRMGAFKTEFSLCALNDKKNPSYSQQGAPEADEEQEELIDPSVAASKAAEEAKAKGEDPDKAARAAAQEAAKKLEEASVKKAAAEKNAASAEDEESDLQTLAEINSSYYIEGKRCVDYNSAFQEALSMLKKEDNGIKVMYGTTSNTTLGICKAVEELGLEDEVVVVGFNSSNLLINYIKSGVLDASIIQNPYNIGYFSVAYAKNLINEEKIPTTLDTGVTIANRENINDPRLQILLYPDEKIEIPESTRPAGAGGAPKGATGGAPEGTTGGAPEGSEAGGPPDGAAGNDKAASNGGNK